MELLHRIRVRKLETGCHGCLILLVTLLNFSSAESGDWDWAVVHSRKISFYSWSNTTLEQHVRHMPVPAPKYPTSVYVANSSVADFNLGTIQGFAKEYLEDEVAGEPYVDRSWSTRELIQMTADRRKNLVYLLAKSKDLQSIVMFNLTSGNSYVVLQSSFIHIDKLEFVEEYLYWNQRSLNGSLTSSDNYQGIWRLKTAGGIASWTAQMYFHDKELVPQDFTVDTSSRIYFIANSSLGNPNIYVFNGESTTAAITSNLLEPRALTTDCSYLYWASTSLTNGYHLVVERVLLGSLLNRSIVVKERGASAFSLAVLSHSTIIWTDPEFDKMYRKRENSEMPLQYTIPGAKPMGLYSSYCKVDKVHAVPLDLRTDVRKDAIVTKASVVLGSDVPKAQASPAKPEPKPTPTTTKAPTTTVVTTLKPALVEELSSVVMPADEPTPKMAPRQSPEVLRPLSSQNPIDSQQIEGSHYVDSHKMPSSLELSWCSSSGHESHCLNGGSCLIIEAERFCLCPSGFGGPKCQVELPLSSNSTDSEEPLSGLTFQIVSSVLSFAVVVLSILSTYLYLRVRDLSKKPRIRRRLIVSRATDSDRSSVCEMVDIENCCNMNECETPCYERTTAAPAAASSRPKLTSLLQNKEGNKKEDRQRLVDS